MNLAHLLARAGRSAGERPALVLGEETVADYAALARRAAALAGGFRERVGLAPGERVALVMRNHPAYVEALFACWHAGLVAVPVNAKLHPRELAFVLADSGAALCLVTPDLAEAAAEAAAAVERPPRILDVAGDDWRRLASGDPSAPAEVAPDEVAWLFYTSGTTGRPKGAMLTHRNLLAMTCAYFADVDRIDPGDAILHAAPMSHGSGLYVLPHVAAAAAHVVPASGRFDPGEIFDLLDRHRGVTIFAAPTMVHRLVASPGIARGAPGLKTIVYGGGPMYLEDCRRALAAFGPRLVQIYGQGESPMTITALSKARHAETGHPRHAERLASVGVAQTVVEVVVAGPDDRPLPAGEVGEVLVRGDTVMRGYWRNAEATERTLRGGWLHTGDLGAFDADGFLTLRDRSKDLIITGGSNVYPREVEEVLLRHEGVAEAAVVGRRHPEWGEEVVAFVVAAEGWAPSAEDLDALCLRHVARFKRPKSYRFVEALPKNEYGKVLKTELRARLEREVGAG